MDRFGDRARILDPQHEPGVAEGLGHCRSRVGDDRQAVVHGLQERHAESLVVAAHDEHVGRVVVRHQHGVVDRTRELDGVVERERAHVIPQRGLVAVRRRAADES